MTTRWSQDLGEGSGGKVEDPAVDAFLEEIIAVCKKHGMCIGHEDGHGSFLVHREIIEHNLGWLRAAAIAKAEPY